MMGKQEYILLKCHSCSTYQVHIDKKSRSFVCSICHIKQSFSRIFGRSTKASDCRKLCSTYNRIPPENGIVEEKNIERFEYAKQENGREGKIGYESSFSGWDAFLCDEEDDDEVNGGSIHKSYTLDGPGKLEKRYLRWSEDDTDIPAHQQSLKKSKGMQQSLGLSRYQMYPKREYCINATNEKKSAELMEISSAKKQSGNVVGQGNASWFAEFLAE